ncbi:hypothetical protein O0L34_g10162 [Tuta absoluta]|nr:hypothetical protein O0L34_g10162 [Tuta absoluta]
MALTTLGELATWEPPPEESEQFGRFIGILDKFYPDNWRLWQVNNVSFEDLFGDEITSDDECRLRFALPTVELAKILNKEQPSLSERRYKVIKRKLLSWPLARATIYSPFSTMRLIHPTEAFNEFANLLPVLKPLFLSRPEAENILKNEANNRASASRSPTSSSKRSHSPDMEPAKKAKHTDDTFLDFMRQQNTILEKLYSISSNQSENIRHIQEHLLHHSTAQREKDSENSEESNSWLAPPFVEQDQSSPSSPTPPSNDSDLSDHSEGEEKLLDFAPETKESEAKIGTASDNLVKQGISCQRLNTDSWQNIRYAEVQKKFQAAPVFTSLKVNSVLATATPSWQLVSVLEKMDLCLGAISHGLLQQRSEFQNIYQNASLEVKKVISKNFLDNDSPFRRTSDALLQYTCGKRAEIIQQRRSIYKPSNKIMNDLLHAIPPSSTHLFSETQLSDLVKDQGGINKFFPGQSKFKPKTAYKVGPRRTEDRPRTRATDSYRKSSYKFPDKPGQSKPGFKRPGASKPQKPRYDRKKFQV